MQMARLRNHSATTRFATARTPPSTNCKDPIDRIHPTLKRVADWRHIATALLLCMTACASDEPPPQCPAVIAPSDADRLTRFDPQGRDLTDVLFEAELEDLQFTCEFVDSIIKGELIVRIAASRGPADAGRLARVHYFVDIRTLDRREIKHEQFEIAIPFPGNKRRSVALDELILRIPLQPGQTGNDFSIYVGFVLTPEELEFNRRYPAS